MSADFNIKVTVRNARLLREIRLKFGSVAAMARAVDVHLTALHALVTMRHPPLRKDGRIRPIAAKVVDALGVEFGDLWPNDMATIKARRATAEFEITAAQVESLANPNSAERQFLLRDFSSRLMDGLTERERRVIACRFEGDATLEEAARELRVTRERIRQLECKALKKMQRRARLLGVTRCDVFDDDPKFELSANRNHVEAR